MENKKWGAHRMHINERCEKAQKQHGSQRGDVREATPVVVEADQVAVVVDDADDDVERLAVVRAAAVHLHVVHGRVQHLHDDARLARDRVLLVAQTLLPRHNVAGRKRLDVVQQLEALAQLALRHIQHRRLLEAAAVVVELHKVAVLVDQTQHHRRGVAELRAAALLVLLVVHRLRIHPGHNRHRVLARETAVAHALLPLDDVAHMQRLRRVVLLEPLRNHALFVS